ncbi:MAG: SpoIIE family protein phosphatase [Armatimonadota bacterium]
MSTRVRASIISAILLTAISIILLSAWLAIQGRQLRAEAMDKASLSIQLLVEASRRSLETGDILGLARLADRTAHGGQVIRIMITDRTGKVVVDTRREAYDERPLYARRALASNRVQIDEYPDRWMASAVVQDELGRTTGLVIADFSKSGLLAAERETRRDGILIAFFGICIGMVLTFFATIYLVRPLTDLVHAIRRVEEGELESPVPVSGPTELVEIGNAFNSMVGAVRQRIQNIELLNQMEANLARARDLPSSVKVIMDTSEALLKTRLCLWVPDALSRILVQVLPPDDSGIPVSIPSGSEFPVARSFKERKIISVGDGCDLPSYSEIAEGITIDSGLVLALWTLEGTTGVLVFVNQHAHVSITKEYRALAWAIAALAAPMVAAAVRAQMQVKAVETLQSLLIPPTPVNIGADVHALYLPAEEVAGVGGDYFDFDDLGESRWAIVIGDASGKGLDAARYATMAKWILRSFIHEYKDLGEVLRQSNGVLEVQKMAEGFITLFCCIWDAAESSIVYANAGHPPALLYRAATGEVEELLPTGTALGIRSDMAFTSMKIILSNDDIFCLYTDGITEARHDDEWYGSDKLTDALKTYAHKSSREIAEGIISTVWDFTGGSTGDDIALLILKVN